MPHGHMDAALEMKILDALSAHERNVFPVEALQDKTFSEQYSGIMKFRLETVIGPMTIAVFNDCDEFDYIEWIEFGGQCWNYPYKPEEQPIMTQAIADWKPLNQDDPRWGKGTW